MPCLGLSLGAWISREMREIHASGITGYDTFPEFQRKTLLA
jgi:hypothetical protein